MEIKQLQAVDFRKLLRQLRIMGLNLNAVGMHANIARTSLRDYEAGTQPLHSAGERLIELWCHMSGNHRDQVPRRLNDPPSNRSLFPQIGALPPVCQR